MSNKRDPLGRNIKVPDDSEIVKQVTYSWLWSSLPWLVVLLALYAFGVIEEITGAVVILVVVLPRYLETKRTFYAISKNSLVYQRGGLFGSQRFLFPFSNIRDVKVRDGILGRPLGYQSVDVYLDKGTVATLNYISPDSNAFDLINKGINEFSSEEEIIDEHEYICPKCKFKVEEDQKFCPECGVNFSSEEEIIDEDIDEDICPECKFKVKEDQKFCPECGADLNR